VISSGFDGFLKYACSGIESINVSLWIFLPKPGFFTTAFRMEEDKGRERLSVI
jgi:hypothetical protein